MRQSIILLAVMLGGCAGPSEYPKLNDVPVRPEKPNLVQYQEDMNQLKTEREQAKVHHQQLRESLGMPADLECQNSDKSRVRRGSKNNKTSGGNPALSPSTSANS